MHKCLTGSLLHALHASPMQPPHLHQQHAQQGLHAAGRERREAGKEREKRKGGERESLLAFCEVLQQRASSAPAPALSPACAQQADGLLLMCVRCVQQQREQGEGRGERKHASTQLHSPARKPGPAARPSSAQRGADSGASAHAGRETGRREGLLARSNKCVLASPRVHCCGRENF